MHSCILNAIMKLATMTIDLRRIMDELEYVYISQLILVRLLPHFKLLEITPYDVADGLHLWKVSINEGDWKVDPILSLYRLMVYYTVEEGAVDSTSTSHKSTEEMETSIRKVCRRYCLCEMELHEIDDDLLTVFLADLFRVFVMFVRVTNADGVQRSKANAPSIGRTESQ